MARQKSEKAKREETEKELKKSIEAKGLKGQIYLDKIEEYMSFYDNLKKLNDYLITLESGQNLMLKNYTDAVGEKRRVATEMRNILSFLGLKPDKNSGGGPPGEL